MQCIIYDGCVCISAIYVMNMSYYRNMKNHKKNKDTAAPVDAFTIDIADDRFKPLFQSNAYAIDPTASDYKPTPSMKQLLSNQQSVLIQQQLQQDKLQHSAVDNEVVEDNKPVSTDMHSLTDKIKRKFQTPAATAVDIPNNSNKHKKQ